MVGAKPERHAVLTWSHAEFDRVWVLAWSGNLKVTHLYLTQPHYGGGLLVSASFSNELEE
jgi:hypothetical protein